MTITIPAPALKAARKLLTRIRFERLTLPALTHILATVDKAGLTLAVTDLDHWLETRVPATIEPFAPGRFLIPAEAFKAATRGDRNTSARLACETTKDGTTLTLTAICGGMPVESVYRPEPEGPFPARPSVAGRITVLPGETFAALATVTGCASADPTRYVLNGVLFCPADGGRLVATDGKRLACAPARVPGREFILPSAATRVLTHPDFLSREAAVMQADDADAPDGGYIQFRSGPHTLIARMIDGNYPDYRCVIPANPAATVTIADTRKPSAIAWLRALRGKAGSVRLSWETPGHMTLTHWHADGTAASIRVPTGIDGNPPVSAFNPAYLAEALEIGGIICLDDHLSPVLVRHPGGNFCVLMCMRDTGGIETPVATKPAAEAPAEARAA